MLGVLIVIDYLCLLSINNFEVFSSVHFHVIKLFFVYTNQKDNIYCAFGVV